MILPYLVALVMIVINIPFGYWRGMTKKFSVAWFVSIHLPVIVSIYFRYLFGIETGFLTILLFVAAFIIGQYSGKVIYSKVNKVNDAK